jgi:hypothetical protein
METNLQNNGNFNTQFGYAIVAGWLILPAIGLIFSFIMTLLSLFPSDSAMTDHTNLYVFSYMLSILYVPFFLILIVKWWGRKRMLPKLMIAYYVSHLFFSLGIYLYQVIAVEGQKEVNLTAVVQNVGITWIVALVWIAYFMKSKRVKATFVKP